MKMKEIGPRGGTRLSPPGSADGYRQMQTDPCLHGEAKIWRVDKERRTKDGPTKPMCLSILIHKELIVRTIDYLLN